MKKIVTTATQATLIILVLVFLAWVLNVSYNRSMIVHCIELQKQSKDYSNFFILKLDKIECSEIYGITIDAPVK